METNRVYTSFDSSSDIIEFYNCTFDRCNFSGHDLSNYEFHECDFNNCDCSLMTVNNCIFDQIHFNGCKLSGTNFSKVNNLLFTVSFVDSNLDYIICEKNSLKNTEFTKCSIREASFIQTNLQSALFAECDLSGTLFDICDIRKANFTSSQNYFIDLDANTIKGALFSLPEAANLLMKYDIKIV